MATTVLAVIAFAEFSTEHTLHIQHPFDGPLCEWLQNSLYFSFALFVAHRHRLRWLASNAINPFANYCAVDVRHSDAWFKCKNNNNRGGGEWKTTKLEDENKVERPTRPAIPFTQKILANDNGNVGMREWMKTNAVADTVDARAHTEFYIFFIKCEWRPNNFEYFPLESFALFRI